MTKYEVFLRLANHTSNTNILYKKIYIYFTWKLSILESCFFSIIAM